MIVGTAGHIDHGKSTLVRALTGVDTDRLPEEKRRGISIELGYAYLPLPDGETLGFVDVPGHEKFVQTMLSGATGIDFALLVVAADDGVMPQTREHLSILGLLGIASGAVALTKTDAVDAARSAEVERELHGLLDATPLAGARIFPVSARTGAGVDALKGFLEATARGFVRPAGSGHFRLAVDRSFTLAGIGTVVTGTVYSGSIHVGAEVAVVPTQREARVRSIHAQNRASKRGSAGERCALNLAGVARDDVCRGDWIVAPEAAVATARLDARLGVLAQEAKPLRSGATVQLHLGAAHVPARVVVLDGGGDGADADEIEPGRERMVQLILRSEIGAWHGDRFVVRDALATRTIGGGRVLDPFAPARYRRSPERMATLAALEASAPEQRLERMLEQAPQGISLARFARACNLRDIDALAAALPARRIVSAGADFLIDHRHWRTLGTRAGEALAEFHASHPDELGPDAGRLKRMAFPRLDDALYRALVADLVLGARIRQTGPWLHLPTHTNAPSPHERALIERVLPRLLDPAFDPPWTRDLARDIGQPEAQLRAALVRAAKRGELFQVVRDLFYHPVAILDLAAIASRLQKVHGEVRAAVFRDETALGRKRAIQILEFFDRVGFTRRVRDRHIVRADNLLAMELPRPPAGIEPRRRAVEEQRP
ncbi:MAG TPA: selenocysteine-specific translation elongation factor [Casimicrobiaceae bacterium]|nr:selenocysteine-specific translation elongation factor [Casimicrobiaceae bacterium]